MGEKAYVNKNEPKPILKLSKYLFRDVKFRWSSLTNLEVSLLNSNFNTKLFTKKKLKFIEFNCVPTTEEVQKVLLNGNLN